VSTFSGLKDFRGENGLYKKMDADKIFDLNLFYQDPSFYYKNTRDLIYNSREVRPSLVHRGLKLLEDKGLIQAVITQNIDLLHKKAGSTRVVEVHGTPEIHRCLSCGKTFDFDTISEIVSADRTPFCPDCRGIIKPDITFFGESLPMEAVNRAIEESSRADLMIVLGSSLVVQPAASFPLYTIQNGGKLVIVNNMETPLDEYAELLYSDLGAVFSFLDTHYR